VPFELMEGGGPDEMENQKRKLRFPPSTVSFSCYNQPRFELVLSVLTWFLLIIYEFPVWLSVVVDNATLPRTRWTQCSE